MTLTWENARRGRPVVEHRTASDHPPELPGRGLAMKATRVDTSKCTVWDGSLALYQRKAGDALTRADREPSPYAWITPICGSDLCIHADHLTVHAPIRLAYPHRICVYCGRHGMTRDHLFPRHWSGDSKRRFVVTVPACGTCNSVLNDTLTWSITERRALCHARLRRHFRKVLATVDFTPDELAEFGHALRSDIEGSLARKAEVLRMLAWPEDPAYDQRALQHSGIADPWAIGLILPDDADLDAIVKGLMGERRAA